MDLMDLPVVDLLSAEYDADPYGAFRAARQHSWLARAGAGYAVLTNADAKVIMRHPDFRVSFAYVDPEVSEYLHKRSESGLMAAGVERHRRLRGVAVRALRPRIMDSLRAPMRSIISSLLDAVVSRDSCDIVQELTDPYPAQVMMPILGVPSQDVPQIDKWATDSVAIFDVARLRTQAAQIEASGREFEAYTRELIAERRHDLGPDLISELIRVQEDEGEKLSEAELLMLVMSLIPAALDTTRGQLGFTLESLVRAPKQWAALVADPSLAPRAVEEGLRYAPAISGIMHEVLRDTSHNGFDFPAGSLVGVYPRAVNRDPAAFPDPDTFDISRDPGPQYTFGFGPHACLGAQLARIEMTEVLGVLAQRIATWELAGEVTHMPMSSNGNRTSLPVTFTVRS
ncbi:MAG TPA: cytochrome P450 [Streptosporangiaceae bacterium]|jgi:cytochrome P450